MAETDLWFGTLTATVRVDNLPASRRVVAIELPADGQWRVCGAGASNAEGVATLPITGLPTSRIYAVAIDDWGRPFVPGMTVAFGDVIRPTQFLGWMYQVTAPGVLPGTEPEWWNSMAGIPQPVGTAMMQAIRHYQPIAHGPVSDIEWGENAIDPLAAYVVSLIRFDEDFRDETGRTWVPVGEPVISNAVRKFGSGSGYFRGSGQCLQTESSSAWAFGVDDFTVECELNLSEIPIGLFFSPAGNWVGNVGCCFFVSPQGVLRWHNGTKVLISPPGVLAQGAFHHIAYNRKGGIGMLFVNGVMVAVQIDTDNYTTTEGWRIGANRTATDWLKGYVDEFRITKGIARYSRDFSPPSAAFPPLET